ncbi:MAG TPA: orotate phosphoribosyltransferase [Sphingobacteriaceae bacterium]|nr:orotate phosphoribosyltransferase [Sphingobacteriaceae bacterium]
MNTGMNERAGACEAAQRLQEALNRSGAMQEGHFRLTSGRHSDRFFLLSLLFQHPALAGEAAGLLADLLRPYGAATVIGPAMGGVILAYETARHLGLRAMYTEKTPPGDAGAGPAMALRRGFRLEPGEKVVMVEDVLTTGGSLRAAIEAVRAAGGDIVAAGVLIDRSGGTAALDVPLLSVWSTTVADWAPEECPLCRQGIPLTLPKA